MGGSALALHQRWKRRAVASRGRHRACTPRHYSDAQPGRRHTHGLHGARPPPAKLKRTVASSGRFIECSSCRDRHMPPAARTQIARQAPSAGVGWGGGSRRTDGTARARPSAIATRCWRHTHGPYGAHAPPAPAGGGCRVARAAQRVLVALRSRRAAGGMHMGRTARTLRQRRKRRAVASRGRYSVCSSRRDRRAAGGTHMGRMEHSLRPQRLGSGVVSRCGTARARPAAIATRRLRHANGILGARHPPALAREDGRVARAAQCVPDPPRLQCSAGCTHIGRTARTLRQRRLGG
jgi:hypothetical protein